MSADTRARSAWDWPDCPKCHSEVFVHRSSGSNPSEYVCEICRIEWGKQ